MISLLVWIALVGLLVWAITTFIPMPSQFKTLIIVVAVVVVLLYLFNAFGLADFGPPVPHFRN